MPKVLARNEPSQAIDKHAFMKRAFTLLELLTVVVIVSLLTTLLLPVLSRTKKSARRMTCSKNLRQINLALRMYADDHSDAIRAGKNEIDFTTTFKASISPYLSQSGPRTNDPIFSCPADDFDCDDRSISELFLFSRVTGKSFCRQTVTEYSSYLFNAEGPDDPGARMNGKAFSAVREPSRVVLECELSGAFGLSAHDRQHPYQFNNARDVMSFVDGHVSYIRIHWNGIKGFDGNSALYEPPLGYEYMWLGK
jgi:prepilin-type N-terminal cleavage/methylation domain-containing protein